MEKNCTLLHEFIVWLSVKRNLSGKEFRRLPPIEQLVLYNEHREFVNDYYREGGAS